jgi:CheY-like chemotaxis protein
VNKAILLVDDEAVLLLAMRQELRLAFGNSFIYETALSAEKGLEAIGQLTQEGVEVAMVISDWLMPGMRGDEFLRKVHSDWPSMKLAMLSGHAEDAQMRRLQEEAGLFACLAKPYGRGSLTALIRSALSKLETD